MPKLSNKSVYRFIFSIFLSFLYSSPVVAEEFLDPDEAFKLRVEMHQDQRLTVQWNIADSYKLYMESMTARALDPAVKLTSLALPQAKRSFDKALEKEVFTFQKTVVGNIVLTEKQPAFDLEVNYQGCAQAGLCYPPQKKFFRIEPLHVGIQTAIAAPEDRPSTADLALELSDSGQVDEASSIQSVLRGGNLVKISAAFLLFGLLLAFTPCALPMLPILSSIIVGQDSPSRHRSFMLALSYSLGMALVYTLLGVAAGLIGEGLAAFMQTPWVLTLFAVMLTAMALSMFDVFQLQLPSSWQGNLGKLSGRFQGGHYFGVFLMGALSTLIVGPCVAGPLAGALLYISQTRDVFIGGFALFSMACGMSVPLLLTGLSAGSLLPRAGGWMTHVKTFFGFMLLAVAMWMITPLLSDSLRLFFWGGLLVLSAIFTPLFSMRKTSDGFFVDVARALGILLLLTGLAEFSGGLMGNSDLLNPLRSTTVSGSMSTEPAQFEQIKGFKDLEAVLQKTDQPVIVDFYADWCTSCLEMEKFTFSDPKVSTELQIWRRLRVDVTRNTAEDRELMKKFKIFGPPAMIFLDKSGSEIPDSRLMGFMLAKPFLQHLKKVIILNKR